MRGVLELFLWAEQGSRFGLSEADNKIMRNPGYILLEKMFMTYDVNNIFAKILSGEIPCDKVFENDHAIAFKDIHPQAPKHLLVIPKGPYVSFEDFSANANDEEISGFIRAVGQVARDAGIVGTGYRILSNHGRDGRQEVPHFHVHVLGGHDLGSMLPRK